MQVLKDACHSHQQLEGTLPAAKLLDNILPAQNSCLTIFLQLDSSLIAMKNSLTPLVRLTGSKTQPLFLMTLLDLTNTSSGLQVVTQPLFLMKLDSLIAMSMSGLMW